MIENVKKIIIDRHKSSNGNCGISVLSIAFSLDIQFAELKPILNLLHQEDFFKVRNGINGKLIFLNLKKNKNE
jgi:hypothetical protein